MDRDSRFINNRKQDKIRLVNNHPSINNMREGEEVLFNHKDGILKRYRKQNGRLWSSNMSTDGNTIVDKKLIANELEYKQKFIDYRLFNHNFKDDIATTKHYVPWSGVGEQTTGLHEQSSFLTPFKMICHSLIIRTENMNDNTQSITFGIEKVDNGDITQDSVATFVHSTDFVANTVTVIKESDWSASPVIPVNALAAITIQTSSSDLQDGESSIFWITSIWKTFIGV